MFARCCGGESESVESNLTESLSISQFVQVKLPVSVVLENWIEICYTECICVVFVTELW